MIQGKLRLVPSCRSLLLAGATAGLRGQSKPAGAEWTTYGGDLASTRYSPLDQINADNFNKLEVAWRFKTDALGPRPEFNFQATPLMVDGVLYTTAGTRRAVVALDAVTGEMLWMHSENEGERGDVGAAPALGPRPRLLDRRPRGRASSTSRPATSWSRSTRRPARRSPASARTASSI